VTGWNDHQKQIVENVLRDANWLIDNESIEAYLTARPYERPAKPPETQPFRNDCSGTIKLVLCDWNGIPSVDGLPSGYGDTASFARAPRGYHVGLDPKRWQLLDVLLYKHHAGPFVAGTAEHATMLIEKVRGVWWCFSMGSTPGPTREKWNYRYDLTAVRRFPIPLA
jgi:hypothetical protein